MLNYGLRSTIIANLHLKKFLKGHFFKFKVTYFEFPANATVVNLGESSRIPQNQDFNCQYLFKYKLQAVQTPCGSFPPCSCGELFRPSAISSIQQSSESKQIVHISHIFIVENKLHHLFSNFM